MDLLLELFSEEIPARMQAKACDDLKRLVTDGLVERGITYASAGTFATPRRLTLVVEDVLERSPDLKEERKGPRADAPEKALEGFLRSTGLTKDQLELRDDKKGQTYFAMIEKPGRPASEVIAETIPEVVLNFPWPKSMRWGSGDLRWVRPLRSILCILTNEEGAEVVPFEVAGFKPGDLTYGHRFHAPDAIKVSGFDQYRSALSHAYVMLDAEERAETIWNDAVNQAFAIGLEVVQDPKLMNEIAGLVEHPVVYIGSIDDAFLELPPEVLKTSMAEHQKFLSVKDPKTDRIEGYVVVANRETKDNGATIMAGNKKVLNARLSDAKFFWENDLRVPLSDMAAKLENVTFHNKLGTQKERVDRIAALSADLAPIVGADAELAKQAGALAKADLSSEMVYEFPELQGIMGGYYARAAGLDSAVAAAASEHYSPLGPSDDVPTAPVSVAVALADKLDTLTGFWAIDEKPTGSKDPFALRRAALGVIRLILDNSVRLPLAPLFKQVLDDAVGIDLLSFFHDRLKVYLRDQGISHDVIDACLEMPGFDDLCLVVARAKALQAFLKTNDGENLLQGFKRANNILTAEEAKDGVSYEMEPDLKFAEVEEERALFDRLKTTGPNIVELIKAEAFVDAMAEMAPLRAPIDAFFEAVQVNSENSVVRRNRLCLLNQIRSVFGGVADFRKLEG
ncbi:MAG: glycine--tRNA ligase subunit beta [Pseudomonadota bacterium]